MKLGTKSLLFGCHQILIHPIFTLIGWVRLYGWGTINFQILIAIIIHDWGYWGCKTMDGHDGSFHPIRCASWSWLTKLPITRREVGLHSRHLCKKGGVIPSRLCWADKLGLIITPPLLWAILAYTSGEGEEYMDNPFGNDYVIREEKTLAGLIRFHHKFKDQIKWIIQMHTHNAQAQ